MSVAALGALIGRTGLVSADAVRHALTEIVGKKRPAVLEADLAVFERGLAFGAGVPAGT